MIKVYAVSLAIGVIGLVVVIFTTTLSFPSPSEGDNRDRTPGEILKTSLGAVLGFGMGGMSAEFSPLDLSWQVSLIVAAMAAVVAVLWVRYSLRPTRA